MKTSTPTVTNVTKRRSLIQANSFISLDQNEDAIESELQNRRLEAINKSTETRKSAAAPLLDLKHYQDCIKLSTENKINSKNAFSLLLIDLMGAMTKKKDSEINKNFQFASCTLDASVKIYGYRVDSVHTDAIKMVTGIGKTVTNKPEEGDLSGDGEDHGGDGPMKKVRKKKRKSTVVKPESLNQKNDLDILLDITPRQNLFSTLTNFNELLLKIPRFNDNCSYMVDPDFPVWPFDGNEQLVPQIDQKHKEPVPDLMKIFSDVQLQEGKKLCRFYSGFKFGEDNENNSDNEMEMSQDGDQFEFDLNASVASIPGSELDDSFNQVQNKTKIDVPATGYESGEEIVVDRQNKRFTSRVNIADMKKRLTMNTLEYSLFDEQVFKSWAGPTHWKIRPTFCKNSTENKENEEGVKQTATKRTRKGRALPPVGLFDVDWNILTKHLSLGEKTTLTQATMHNWDANNTSMPIDCKYKAKTLFTLFHSPSVVINPRVKDEVADESYGKESEDEDQDNAEELEYCSSLGLHPNEDLGTNPIPDTQIANDEYNVQQWDVENMVAVPNKVEKIIVSSFKRVKHIDIKHLKKVIWNSLAENKNNKTEEKKMTTTLSFKQLLEISLPKMSSSLASSLSPSLMFNALLHLTNEKCLILKQEKDMKKIDFEISQ